VLPTSAASTVHITLARALFLANKCAVEYAMSLAAGPPYCEEPCAQRKA
jgi:hypothetical protein